MPVSRPSVRHAARCEAGHLLHCVTLIETGALLPWLQSLPSSKLCGRRCHSHPYRKQCRFAAATLPSPRLYHPVVVLGGPASLLEASWPALGKGELWRATRNRAFT